MHRGKLGILPVVANQDVLAGTFQELPKIDISPLVEFCSSLSLNAASPESSPPSDVRRVASEIDAACREVGFFYLTGHGVPQQLMDSVREAGREFFALPEENKNEIALSKSPIFRGYQRLGENITQGRHDMHEAIDLYREHPADHPDVLSGKPLHGPNPWPSRPERFKPVVQEYVTTMKGLGRTVLRGMAMGLHLPLDTFEHGRADDPFWVIRVIGYPPLASSDTESLSCGEHTDYGLLTFVNQDPGITALQVKNKAGEWVDAPPVPGSFVVNIGDMLKLWTNGLYQPTPHRVVNRSRTFRVSVPFFYEPNFDVRVEPLNALVKTMGPTGLGPVVYGDHLCKKVFNNFG
ncbi:hypothetical protein CLOM_g2184 [Closterium sp. NIES-68]|nr:hypothetical protein CLOM_g2184 [Closterium sp. NIES-68]GJP68805.1 hypothetical protein CLOP_g25460 [Closterium sp. NIES-67]